MVYVSIVSDKLEWDLDCHYNSQYDHEPVEYIKQATKCRATHAVPIVTFLFTAQIIAIWLLQAATVSGRLMCCDTSADYIPCRVREEML